MSLYRFSASTPGPLVIVMRHGKTVLNNPSRPTTRGWEDVPLSPEGKIEVQISANKLKALRPQSIASSDLMRDTSTAQIVADVLGISDIETDWNARTWDIGDYSGQPEDEVNPAIVKLYRSPWVTPPGSSESCNGFSERWVNCLERWMDIASKVKRPIVIVTHGRCCALTQAHLEGVNMLDCVMPLPAGYMIVNVESNRDLTIQWPTPTEPIIADV